MATTVTVVSITPVDQGVSIVVQRSDNAQTIQVDVPGTPSIADMRLAVAQKVRDINSKQGSAGLYAALVGQSITVAG